MMGTTECTMLEPCFKEFIVFSYRQEVVTAESQVTHILLLFLGQGQEGSSPMGVCMLRVGPRLWLVLKAAHQQTGTLLRK
jgi:hypothetical protein